MSKERMGSLFFFLLGLYALYHAIQLPIGTWAVPGSAAFPGVISILLVLVGGVLFLSAKGDEKVRFSWSSIRQVQKPLQIVGLSIFFILALERLGFLIVVSLFLFVFFLWVSRYRWWVALLFSLVISPASWFFFERILGLHLPSGPFRL